MYCAYIIKSLKDNKFYTGSTADLDRRFEEHNKGNNSTPSTLRRGPFKLVHVEIADTIQGARRIEKYFKSGTGREVRDELFK